MTREEAKRIAQGLITDFKCESQTMVEFCNVVIEALEQESILDTIKAEIDQIEINGHIRDAECFCAGINAALNVINKYRAESEVRE